METHKLDDFTSRCTCKDPFCKKWKENFSTPDKAKYCPQCWTRLSLHEDNEGNRAWWCFNCNTTKFSSS